MISTRRLALTLALPLALLLGACASGPAVIHSQVQAAATPASAGQPVLQPGARYRFERTLLPQGTSSSARLETLAEAALARVGLTRDEVAAQITVQLDGQHHTFWLDNWGRPWPYPYGWGGGRLSLMYGGTYGGFMLGGPWWWDDIYPAPVHAREVRLLMRDVRNGQPLYEARARHDGSSGNTDLVMWALLNAALQDFPHPPSGWRSLQIPLADDRAPSTPAGANITAPLPPPPPMR